jgi:hypothetical protein
MRYKKYGVNIKETYFKRSRPGNPPIAYTAQGYSSGKVTDANIRKDPILKRHPKLERAMLRHEMNEIKLRSRGMNVNKAHRIARSQEPSITRNLSLRQMWDKLRK